MVLYNLKAKRFNGWVERTCLALAASSGALHLIKYFSKRQSRYSCQCDVVQNKVLVFIEIYFCFVLFFFYGRQGASLRCGHGKLFFFNIANNPFVHS